MVLAASGHEELLSLAEPLLSDLPSVPHPDYPESVYVGGQYRHEADSGVGFPSCNFLMSMFSFSFHFYVYQFCCYWKLWISWPGHPFHSCFWGSWWVAKWERSCQSDDSSGLSFRLGLLKKFMTSRCSCILFSCWYRFALSGPIYLTYPNPFESDIKAERFVEIKYYPGFQLGFQLGSQLPLLLNFRFSLQILQL